MNVKQCCEDWHHAGYITVDDETGIISLDDSCCGCILTDFRFCPFCGKKYELEGEK